MGKAGKASVGEQELMPNKWNKDKEGAWQLDVDIGVSWFNKGDDDMEEEGKIAISEIIDSRLLNAKVVFSSVDVKFCSNIFPIMEQTGCSHLSPQLTLFCW